jgi:hypothetical protein
MLRAPLASDAGGMNTTPPRNRLRIAMAPAASMHTVNVLLAVAAALCVLAVAAGTLAR